MNSEEQNYKSIIVFVTLNYSLVIFNLLAGNVLKLYLSIDIQKLTLINSLNLVTPVRIFIGFSIAQQQQKIL